MTSSRAALQLGPHGRTRSSNQVFPAVAAVVFLISVAFWWPVLSQPALVHRTPLWMLLGALLLIIAFIACELFPLRVEVRRETLLVSLSELPLVLGLLLLPSWTAGAAQLTAGALVYLVRKDSWFNSALNLSLIAVEAGAGAAAMLFVGTRTDELAWNCLAVAVGVLFGALVSAVAVGLAYKLMGPSESLRRVVGRSMLAAAAIVTFALVAYVLWRVPYIGPILCLGLALVLVVLYRTYFRFLRQHASLAGVYGFGRSVAIAGEEPEDWPNLVEQVREQLNASVAVLRLTEGGTETRTLAAGPEGPVDEPPAPVAMRCSNSPRGRARPRSRPTRPGIGP